jgi:transcriptional regulator with XRE-family HTH domain
MAIGLVTDDLFESEINSLNRTKSADVVTERAPTVVDITTRGRDKGDVNVPDSLRKVIADTHLMDGRDAALELAADFGISPSSVSAYAKGATSTTSYNNPSKSLIQHINKSRERAVKRAGKTLNAALGAITQEKLDYTDADKLSGIAKDMSVIIKNLEPQQTDNSGSAATTPQFVIFAPSFKDERSYDSIVVQE